MLYTVHVKHRKCHRRHRPDDSKTFVSLTHTQWIYTTLLTAARYICYLDEGARTQMPKWARYTAGWTCNMNAPLVSAETLLASHATPTLRILTRRTVMFREAVALKAR